MKTKSSSVLFVLVLLTTLVAAVFPTQPVLASSPNGRDPSVLAANQVSGYKLPWAQSYGKAIQVTGVRTSHTKYNNVPRQSIDFGTPMNTSVVAMKAGVVVTAQDLGDTGKLIEVDTQDGYCSVYLHLSSITKSGGQVRQGEEIGKSGKLLINNKSSVHTHIAVYQKNGRCEGYGDNPKTREAVIIFDEVGRELNYNDWVTSQNVDNGDKIAFENGVSKIGITTEEVTLQVSGDNINGKTVYWQLWRPALNGYGERVWNGQGVASGNSITFKDMDGAGPIFQDATYYTVASLNPIGTDQAKQKRTSCAVDTNFKMLCDAGSYSDIIMPPPSDSFVNGVSQLTSNADEVVLKVTGDNINGKTVYWQLWRPALNGYGERVWNGQGVASGNSITFKDMDGAGPIFQDATYYTVASLSPIGTDQAKQKRTSCAVDTNFKMLCDAVSYSPPPILIPLPVPVCTPGNSVGDDFMLAVINNLNTQTEYPISNTEFAVKAMRIWQRYENTNACWNPLATTWGWSGSTNFNSVGVKNYAESAHGISATANTIGTKNTAASYSAIRKMLALQGFDEAGIAANLKIYSGGGGYVTNVMNEWRTLYNNTKPIPVDPPVDPAGAATELSCPATAKTGSSMDCTLSVRPNGGAITGLQINLDGMSNILKLTSTQFEALAGNDPINLSTETKVVWAGANGATIEQSGVLATLTFDVLQAGTAEITGTASAVNAQNAAVTTSFIGTSVSTEKEPNTGSDQTNEGTINGKASLSFGNDASSVTASLVDGAGQVVASTPLNVDGAYQLSAPLGAYTLKLNAPGYLRAEKQITLADAQPVDAGSVKLLAGDINGDDKINPSDLISLGAAYEISPLTLNAADYNKDGVINIFDLTIFAQNYRQTGPIAW